MQKTRTANVKNIRLQKYFLGGKIRLQVCIFLWEKIRLQKYCFFYGKIRL